jgi:transposase
MLAEAAGIKRIILAVGYTDLRKGVDSLAQIIGTRYDLNPFEKDVLFLFCGRRSDRIKGLIWEGNGFLLLYKRLEDGSFSWPRTPEEAAELTPQQYRMLMMGLDPLHPKIRDVNPEGIL